MIRFRYLYRCKKCGKRLSRDEEYCTKCKRELCQNDKDEKPKKPNINEASKKPAKCLVCGNSCENDKLYCSDCFNKEVKPKIKYKEQNKDKEIKCINGTIVRSKEELIVSSVLYVNGIKHTYEYPLYIKEINRFIRPDFFLPEIKTRDGKTIKNVFLEHFGWHINEHDSIKDFFDDRKYEKTTNKKLPKYRDMGLTVICTSYEDLEDPCKSANEKIMNKILDCKEGTVNYVDETMLYSKHYEKFMKSLEETDK